MGRLSLILYLRMGWIPRPPNINVSFSNRKELMELFPPRVERSNESPGMEYIARQYFGCDRKLVKSPAIKSVSFRFCIALTILFAFGFQECGLPFASIRAI